MYFGYYTHNGLIFCQRWQADMPQRFEFKAKWLLPEVHHDLLLDTLKRLYPCPRELIDEVANPDWKPQNLGCN